MKSLARAVEKGRSGIYRVAPGKPGEIASLARAAGLALHTLDLGRSTHKSELLAAVARELRFPDWFGENWDALQDALCDLSWLPESRGTVLLIEGADAVRATAPGELDTLVDVLRSAARYWQDEQRPFLVLVAGGGAQGLATLS